MRDKAFHLRFYGCQNQAMNVIRSSGHCSSVSEHICDHVPKRKIPYLVQDSRLNWVIVDPQTSSPHCNLCSSFSLSWMLLSLPVQAMLLYLLAFPLFNAMFMVHTNSSLRHISDLINYFLQKEQTWYVQTKFFFASTSLLELKSKEITPLYKTHSLVEREMF